MYFQTIEFCMNVLHTIFQNDVVITLCFTPQNLNFWKHVYHCHTEDITNILKLLWQAVIIQLQRLLRGYYVFFSSRKTRCCRWGQRAWHAGYTCPRVSTTSKKIAGSNLLQHYYIYVLSVMLLVSYLLWKVWISISWCQSIMTFRGLTPLPVCIEALAS